MNWKFAGFCVLLVALYAVFMWGLLIWGADVGKSAGARLANSIYSEAKQ